jgi:hypothetical protein
MNWNDLEIIWRRQQLPTGANSDLATLRETFESKSRKTRLRIQLRNLSEGGAGLIVIPVFLRFAWVLGRDAWPLFISALILAGITFRFFSDALRVYRTRLGPEASLLAKVGAEIAELRHQRKFLSRWESWYLLPCAAAIALGFWGLIRGRHEAVPADYLRVLFTTPATLVFILLFVGTVTTATWMAWRAVKKSISGQIEPRICELEMFRDSLDPK